MLPLKSYSNPIAAALVKTLLEDYEIACVLFDEHVNSLGYLIAFPVRLMVADSEVERAVRILRHVEAAPVPNDEEAAADDRAEIIALDEQIFGEQDLSGEQIESPARNNPWEVLAIAYLFLIPGIGFVLDKRWLLVFVGGHRGNRWLRLSPPDLHLLGAILICAAITLTLAYFAARKPVREETSQHLYFV